MSEISVKENKGKNLGVRLESLKVHLYEDDTIIFTIACYLPMAKELLQSQNLTLLSIWSEIHMV